MEIQEAIQQLTIQRTFTKGSNAKVEAIDMAIQALKMQQKMMQHCEGSCVGCHYYNPTNGDKCMNDFIIDCK